MVKRKEIVVDKELNEVKKLFGKLIDYGYSPYETFDDFLNVVIISILNAVNRNNPEFDENEEKYKKIVEKYGENGVDTFSQILALFINKMEKSKEVYTDWIGEYFMQEVSHGEHGQYFTPDSVASVCAQVVMHSISPTLPSVGGEKTYYDCACGSSRMLLQSQALKRGKSIGIDIDRRCILMSVFNHFFYGLKGEFTVGDGLKEEVREKYVINTPFIYHYVNHGNIH